MAFAGCASARLRRARLFPDRLPPWASLVFPFGQRPRIVEGLLKGRMKRVEIRHNFRQAGVASKDKTGIHAHGVRLVGQLRGDSVRAVTERPSPSLPVFALPPTLSHIKSIKTMLAARSTTRSSHVLIVILILPGSVIPSTIRSTASHIASTVCPASRSNA